MKVMITGGSGFLGINLVRFLLKTEFNNIVVLDTADFDYPEKSRIHFIKGDIRDKKTVERAMEGAGYVIHCAAALPLYKREDIFSTEVAGTNLLLEQAYQQKVERFVHISSTAVYGVPDHHPLYETDKMIGVGAYGEAKIDAEKLCCSYRSKGMCVSILRPKSFIGPERLGVFALFYDWAKDKRSFPVLGNGKNKYQFLDVEDLCDAILLCLTKEKEKVNDVFNIGANEFSTMREDFQSILDYAGYGKKIKCFPAEPAVLMLRFLELLRLSPLYKWVYETAAKDSFVSIEKAQQVLGYNPKYSNKDALLRNYKWYLHNLHIFENQSGISHRVPWKQGILKVAKRFF